MKKILISLIVFATIIVSGCKTTPSVENMSKISYKIGVSAAMVCNMSNVSNEQRETVREIIVKLQNYTPSNHAELANSWESIINAHLDASIHDGKITYENSQIIKDILLSVTNAIDYIVHNRWPTLLEKEENTYLVINNFCEGFLHKFTSENVVSVSSDLDYDEEAYNYLLTKVAK